LTRNWGWAESAVERLSILTEMIDSLVVHQQSRPGQEVVERSMAIVYARVAGSVEATRKMSDGPVGTMLPDWTIFMVSETPWIRWIPEVRFGWITSLWSRSFM
jgi:hypothetical protein